MSYKRMESGDGVGVDDVDQTPQVSVKVEESPCDQPTTEGVEIHLTGQPIILVKVSQIMLTIAKHKYPNVCIKVDHLFWSVKMWFVNHVVTWWRSSLPRDGLPNNWIDFIVYQAKLLIGFYLIEAGFCKRQLENRSASWFDTWISLLNGPWPFWKMTHHWSFCICEKHLLILSSLFIMDKELWLPNHSYQSGMTNLHWFIQMYCESLHSSYGSPWLKLWKCANAYVEIHAGNCWFRKKNPRTICE